MVNKTIGTIAVAIGAVAMIVSGLDRDIYELILGIWACGLGIYIGRDR